MKRQTVEFKVRVYKKEKRTSYTKSSKKLHQDNFHLRLKQSTPVFINTKTVIFIIGIDTGIQMEIK